MLIAMINENLISANSVVHENTTKMVFVCPCCRSTVILKRGKYRIAHFSHQANATCVGFSENESEAHLKGKLTFKRQVREMGYRVEIEVVMPSIEQRADVFLPDEQFVIEYQCSPISFDEINRRTRNYRHLGNQVIWILGGRHRSRALTSEAVAKFARFQAHLGFYIVFYEASAKQFWLYDHIQEIAGKLNWQSQTFNSLAEILAFIKTSGQLSDGQSLNSVGRSALLQQLRRIQQSNILKSPTYREMVTACYRFGRLFVGCPMICHGKQAGGLPIFKQTILCWKVWLVLEIFETGLMQLSNRHLNDLFVQSVNRFGRQMVQVNNYVRFYQIEFLNFINGLRSQGYLRHTVNGVQIIRRPEWFGSYDQKRQFIMTAARLM
ncbi:competence protein [Lentilactobacillus fungorum]|uniref:Competence protein n=1 Tax=Lentilactobacillus fungorum TaxID=2201250 RepID=A0ABQ3W2D4_9LACO|nr:competence protein CoiA family protein [Lentilactobacillus fungorum]GHP14985.1 competence protein [Lentilactobacillus fungorum]